MKTNISFDLNAIFITKHGEHRRVEGKPFAMDTTIMKRAVQPPFGETTTRYQPQEVNRFSACACECFEARTNIAGITNLYVTGGGAPKEVHDFTCISFWTLIRAGSRCRTEFAHLHIADTRLAIVLAFDPEWDDVSGHQATSAGAGDGCVCRSNSFNRDKAGYRLRSPRSVPARGPVSRGNAVPWPVRDGTPLCRQRGMPGKGRCGAAERL